MSDTNTEPLLQQTAIDHLLTRLDFLVVEAKCPRCKSYSLGVRRILRADQFLAPSTADVVYDAWAKSVKVDCTSCGELPPFEVMPPRVVNVVPDDDKINPQTAADLQSIMTQVETTPCPTCNTAGMWVIPIGASDSNPLRAASRKQPRELWSALFEIRCLQCGPKTLDEVLPLGVETP